MFKLSIFLLLILGIWLGVLKQLTNGQPNEGEELTPPSPSSAAGSSEAESIEDSDSDSESNEICVDVGCETNEKIVVEPQPSPHKITCKAGLVYDSKSGNCLSTVGGTCTTQADCHESTICSPIWSTEKGVFEGICVCDKNFYASHNHTTMAMVCVPKAKYDEPCDPETHPCEDTNSLLICNPATSKCSCLNETAHVYEESRGECSIRVGEYCYKYRTQFHICVSHAVCKYHLGHKLTDKLRCKCKAGYHSMKNGTSCVGGYGHVCAVSKTWRPPSTTSSNNNSSEQMPLSPQDGCDTERGLVCTNGQCLCARPLTQVYDEKLHACASIIGASCEKSSECIYHAICSSLSRGECACKPEYSATSDGFACKKRYGAYCSNNDTAPTPPCNSDAGLVCRGNTCQCLDPSLIYRPAKDACVSSAGKICGRLPVTVNQAHWIWKAAGTFHNMTRPPVQVGCEDGFLCARIQGQSTCRCLAADAMDLDRTYRIDLCL